MPGRVYSWPDWPEFGNETPVESKDSEFLEIKRTVIEEYGAETLIRSWIAVCKSLEQVTEEIATKRSAIVPVFSAAEILDHGFGNTELDQIKKTGCFVVKSVLPREETNELYQSFSQYVSDNRAQIKGWPAETPSMLMLYDSPVQNTIRTHPNQLQLQRRLNELWHDETGETSADPLIYLDGVRDRPPHQNFLGLGPHIDAGSLCRWADPAYRKVYSHIFGGEPEKHDPWDLGLRKDALQDLYQGQAHSTVLRTFQGWTALTRAAPNEGTLLLVPSLAPAIAYVLLRPFFKPPQDVGDIMDASKWSLDDSAVFPGTMKPHSQRLSRSSHPHLRLEECLVHIPVMEAGDTIWWHTDLCHAVDPEHTGSQNASVAYVPACPTTEANKTYVKTQLDAILEGRAPPDYGIGSGSNETLFKGYKGHVGISEEARKAFGYNL